MSSYDDKIQIQIEEESMLYDKKSFITLEKHRENIINKVIRNE
jgi:hypothetical protein